MSRPICAADRWIAAWNLVMAVIWLAAVPVTPWGWPAAAAHVAAATLPLLLRRVAGKLPRPVRFAREAYLLFFIILAWGELGLLHAARPAATQDALVMRLDAALPGAHLHETWMPAMPAMWFSELMHGFYISYYLFIFLPPILLAARGRIDDYRDWTFRLLVTYLGCYAFYAIFPVLGPRIVTEPFHGALTNGFFYGLTHGARELGDSPGTAFPSSHVAGVVTAAWLAARRLRRPWPAVFAAGAVLVALSTVYTRNHYTVDVLAGLVAAVLLQLTVGRLFESEIVSRLRSVPARRKASARQPAPARRSLLPEAREGRCES